MTGVTARGNPRITEVDEVDSTSSQAMRRAAAGERGPLWIRAEHQTGGRGRSGRAWSTPRSNLAASLIFEPGCQIGHVHQLALLAGVAVHDAIVNVMAGPTVVSQVRLKWPNDVLIGGAKLGGILTESTTFASALVVVVGVGVNIRIAPSVAGRATTCLGDHVDAPPTPQHLLSVLAHRLDAWLVRWDRGACFDAVLAAWLDRALPLGHAMTIQSGTEPISGIFTGLDPTGALLLTDTTGKPRRFSYGDVTLQPAKEPEP